MRNRLDLQSKFKVRQIVFSKCGYEKPWPAKIQRIITGKPNGKDFVQFIYIVRYFLLKRKSCISSQTASELQPFNEITVAKYRHMYRKTKDKQELTILTIIEYVLSKINHLSTKEEESLGRVGKLKEVQQTSIRQFSEKKSTSKSLDKSQLSIKTEKPKKLQNSVIKIHQRTFQNQNQQKTKIIKKLQKKKVNVLNKNLENLSQSRKKVLKIQIKQEQQQKQKTVTQVEQNQATKMQKIQKLKVKIKGKKNGQSSLENRQNQKEEFKKQQKDKLINLTQKKVDQQIEVKKQVIKKGQEDQDFPHLYNVKKKLKLSLRKIFDQHMNELQSMKTQIVNSIHEVIKTKKLVNYKAYKSLKINQMVYQKQFCIVYENQKTKSQKIFFKYIQFIQEEISLIKLKKRRQILAKMEQKQIQNQLCFDSILNKFRTLLNIDQQKGMTELRKFEIFKDLAYFIENGKKKLPNIF